MKSHRRYRYGYGALLSLFMAFVLLVVPQLASANACSTWITVKNGTRRQFANCSALPGREFASIAWNFDSVLSVLEIAFTGYAPKPGGWVGWGLNSVESRMVGSSVLVGFSASNGSNVLPYKLTNGLLMSGGPLRCSPIDLDVIDKSVSITSTNAYSAIRITIYAYVQLRPNQTVVNQVWNSGDSVTNFEPSPHLLEDDQLTTFATLDLNSGSIVGGNIPVHRSLKNRHGYLSAVGWGILLPLGVFAARYLRPFQNLHLLWFFVHIFCQLGGYATGVAGLTLGFLLHDFSVAEGTVNLRHRNLGIAIFTFASCQILTLLVRPKPKYKLRKLWNIFHHSLGYATIVLIIVNVFEGLEILNPGMGWRRAYSGYIVVLGFLSVIMEVVIWLLYFVRKSRQRQQQGTMLEFDETDDQSGHGNNNDDSSEYALYPRSKAKEFDGMHNSHGQHNYRYDGQQ